MLKTIKNGKIKFDRVLLIKTLLIYTLSLFIFTIVYFMIYKYDKKSFYSSSIDKGTSGLTLFDFFHFSLVTQTTVGYGDVYPKSNLSKFVNTIHLCSIYIILIISFL